MSVNATLSKFYRVRSKILSRHYAQYGLTILQVTVLFAIYENDGSIQRELCELVDTSPTVMVGVLSALEKNGLIERRYCPTNRRIINVFITQAGIELTGHLHEMISKIEEDHMSMLSQEEQAAFHALLKKALDSWQTVFDGQE